MPLAVNKSWRASLFAVPFAAASVSLATGRLAVEVVQARLFGVSKSHARAHTARSVSADPFLGSPADFRTHAPNFLKLGQTGRARQDLVCTGKYIPNIWGFWG